jgi:hypothetical protein
MAIEIRGFQIELDGTSKIIRAECVVDDGVSCAFYSGGRLVSQLSNAELLTRPKAIYGLLSQEKSDI